MNSRIAVLVLLSLLLCPLAASGQDDLKVFISVDMEGIAGVVTSEECSSSGPDYGYFRRIMSHEANAAVLGAFDAGANGLIAGHFGVPVVYVAGDQAIVDQVQDLFGSVGTYATKQGYGAASLGVHPEVAQREIRAGVANAVRNRDRFSPYTKAKPYTRVLKLKSEASVYNGSFFPGARRTGDWELTFASDDILQVMYAFGVMRR